MDQFILKVCKGCSFIDVGPLWGMEKLSIAYKAGATKLAAIDIMPKDDLLWTNLTSKLGPVSGGIDYICGDVCNLRERSYDVVHCSGVLYHHPNPLLFFKTLHRISNNYVLLGTTVTSNVVKNRFGIVNITPGAALFLPAVPENNMKILRKDWELWLDGRPGDILSEENINWDIDNLQHWWWLFTREYVEALASLVGFEIQKSECENRVLSLLLRKI